MTDRMSTPELPGNAQVVFIGGRKTTPSRSQQYFAAGESIVVMAAYTCGDMDHRTQIRDFLMSRRGRLKPEQVGMPTSTRRRVPGLRREEVAVLAGVSPEWYTRLEKGHISEVSESVLRAVADALQLNSEERSYLFDLAQAAKPTYRTADVDGRDDVTPQVHWMLDSITLSAVFVRNGSLDVIACNDLAYQLHRPMFDSFTTTAHNGVANFARYHFHDPGSRAFFADWQSGAEATVALLRAEAGRNPGDTSLSELIDELSHESPEFQSIWASYDIRTKHEGYKRLNHPDVGMLETYYQSVVLPTASDVWQDLSFYTAEPGSVHNDNMRRIASKADGDRKF